MERESSFFNGRPAAVRTIVDPASLEPVGESVDADRPAADKAIAAAVQARDEWAACPERGNHMRAAAERVETAGETLAALLTREQGKPLSEARLEIDRFVLWMRHYADTDLAPRNLVDTAQRHIDLHRRPIGVVLAITPWNFLISLLAWKLAPALAIGNPVIVKPSRLRP